MTTMGSQRLSIISFLRNNKSNLTGNQSTLNFFHLRIKHAKIASDIEEYHTMNIVEIQDFLDPRLDVYARLNEPQLKHYFEHHSKMLKISNLLED